VCQTPSFRIQSSRWRGSWDIYTPGQCLFAFLGPVNYQWASIAHWPRYGIKQLSFRTWTAEENEAHWNPSIPGHKIRWYVLLPVKSRVGLSRAWTEKLLDVWTAWCLNCLMSELLDVWTAWCLNCLMSELLDVWTGESVVRCDNSRRHQTLASFSASIANCGFFFFSTAQFREYSEITSIPGMHEMEPKITSTLTQLLQ